MDEILQKLLSSELLSEDAKAEISTSWTSAVEKYKTDVREEVTMTVRAEIAEQWADERDALVENIETFVNQKLTEELADLQGDIDRFRDLEAEYAEKIVEEKHEMAELMAEEIDGLINKMDAFFELRLTEELEDLKEDLEIVKQNEFGRKIFEAFQSTFASSYVDEDSVQAKLAATLDKLRDAESTIGQLEESQSKLVREAKMDQLLSSLTGKKREQMQFVLQTVETNRLEEAYKHFIGRVLKEDDADTRAALTESTVVTGNGSTEIPTKTNAEKYSNLRKLAGIN